MKTSTLALQPSDDRAELLDGIAGLVRDKALVELRLREQLVELEHQTPVALRKFVSDELAVVLAESSRTAQGWIEDALMLEDHPEVKALVEQGTWTVRHADAVLDELAGSVDRGLRQQVLDLVLGQTSARTPHQLRKATRAAVFLVDPEAAEKRAEKARERRSVNAHDERDGSATLFMNGPKAAVAAALAGLDALCLPRAPEDTRSIVQRRFDALLGLITGQVTAVGAHVQLLMSLATLEGGDEAAEIPGLGLITATEARELAADASEIRRVVVDAAGQLVSVDSTAVRPEPQAASEPVRLLTDQIEPTPVTDQLFADAADGLGHEAGDEAWLAAQQDAQTDPEQAGRRAAQEWADYCHPCPGEPDAAAQTQLRQILAVIAADGRRAGLANVLIDTDGTIRIHWPDDPDPEGGIRAPDPPPLPTPPWPEGFVDDQRVRAARDAGTELPSDPDERARITRQQWLRRQVPSWPLPRPEAAPTPHPGDRVPALSDWQWWDETEARAVHQAVIGALIPVRAAMPPPEQGWPARSTRPSVWSDVELLRCAVALSRRPVDRLPRASSSYPFTGRLARHLKVRDQTCRFPGCSRLAQHCDSDHRIPWPAGPTSVANGVSECEHHHQAKHAIFSLTQLPAGTLRWTLPTGHAADSPPRALLRGW
ncbi:MAG: hypothetical protein QOD70_47 [Frankiales bacterium]|nr:hypothetical protein [Frankiales bacterium]